MKISEFKNMSRRDFLKAMGAAIAATSTTTVLSACNRLPFLGSGTSNPMAGEEGTSEGIPCLVVCQSTSLSSFDLDPLKAISSETVEILSHAFSGLARWRNLDGVITVTPEFAEKLVEPTKNENGTVTYAYTIVKGATWSDGRPITAHDFVFSWNHAANINSGCPYRDLFNCIEGYSDASDMRLSVVATDDRHLSVTLVHDIPYWNDLLAFSSFLPIRSDFIGDNFQWHYDVESCPYSGPFSIVKFSLDTVDENLRSTGMEMMVFKKREDYPYADSITVDELRFIYKGSKDDRLKLIQGADSGDLMLSENETPYVHIIAHASQGDITDSHDIAGINRRAAPLLGTEWLLFNVNRRLLPDDNPLIGDDYEMAQAEVRHAIALLMDRESIPSKYFGMTPASSIVPSGMSDTGGSDFASNAGNISDNGYSGYIDVTSGSTSRNQQAAIEILKRYYLYDPAQGKFLNVPELQLMGSGAYSVYATDTCVALNRIGINVKMELVEYPTKVEHSRDGSYQMTDGNWFADYTDPISFLSLWNSNHDMNYCQFGRETHAMARCYSLDLSGIGEETTIANATWAETYDVLLDRIANETDRTKRFALLHQAEDLLMSTWAVMPALHPAILYLTRDNITGIEATPFNWMFYGYVTQEK